MPDLNLDAETVRQLGEEARSDPWVLPSQLPDQIPSIPGLPGGGSSGAGDGDDIPPGGVEAEMGQPCSELGMDAMDPNSPEVEAAKWAQIYDEGKWPWCVPKGGTSPTPAPTTPTTPALPSGGGTSEPIDQFCRDQGYVPESEAKRNMLIAGGAAFAGGALVGGIIGYLAGR